MENHAPIFAQEAPTRPGRMTGFLAAAMLLAVGIVSFVVARSTARTEVAAAVSAANPIMPAAPAFMPRNAMAMLGAPAHQVALCPSYSTCRNFKFSGQCDACVQCMKTCTYPTSMYCYRIYASACAK